MQPRTALAFVAILALAALCVAEDAKKADAANAASSASYRSGHKDNGYYKHRPEDRYEHMPEDYEGPSYGRRPDDEYKPEYKDDYEGYQRKDYYVITPPPAPCPPPTPPPPPPPCPPANFTGCGQCSVGYIAVSGGEDTCGVCQECATGSTTAAVGAETCDVCLPGYGGQGCAQCQPGTYSTGGAGAVCESCPAGKSSNSGAESLADCQDAACLAAGYFGVTVPSNGDIVQSERVPACTTFAGSPLTDCLSIDPQQSAAVPFYIEPAATDRIITVTTCPQRTDPVVSSVDTVISAFSVSTDGTCALTYQNCNDDWSDDYSAQAIDDLCNTVDDYLSYIEIPIPANTPYVVTVTTYDEDNSCIDGTANPVTPYKVFISESCIETCNRKGSQAAAAKKPFGREQHRADKQKKCGAKKDKRPAHKKTTPPAEQTPKKTAQKQTPQKSHAA